MANIKRPASASFSVYFFRFSPSPLSLLLHTSLLSFSLSAPMSSYAGTALPATLAKQIATGKVDATTHQPYVLLDPFFFIIDRIISFFPFFVCGTDTAKCSSPGERHTGSSSCEETLATTGARG
jgi:hypothetical protein